MQNEVEKQTKLVGELEAREADLVARLAAARQGKTTITASHKAALERLGSGDQSVRKELTKLSAELQEVDQDVAAFSAAVQTTTTKLTEAKIALRRFGEQEANDRLEREMANFDALSGDLQSALQQVATKSNALLTAISAVGEKLCARDPHRWNRTGHHLQTEVRAAIMRCFLNLGKAVPTQSFSEAVGPDLKRIVAALRFESAGRRMAATRRGQRLYRVRSEIFLYDVTAQAGDVFPLMPDDANTRRLLGKGSIELVSEAEQHETSGATVAA